MCEPTTIALAATAISGGMQAYGQYQQGRVAQQVGRNNQMMAEYAAADAERRGEEEAIAARRRADQLAGAQRAAFAARGVDATAGTAADLLAQTTFFGQQDQDTARTNARREAWSLRAQGANARAQGNAAARAGRVSAFGTLLGAGARVASKWV